MNNLPYSQEMKVISTEATFLSLGKIHCLKLCKSPCSICSQSRALHSCWQENKTKTKTRQLPLKDSPSPPPASLLHRPEHWGALRHPSCSYIFSTFSKFPLLLSFLSEYPLKWWVFPPLFHGLEHNHWQKHCFQSILFAYVLVSIFCFVFCC